MMMRQKKTIGNSKLTDYSETKELVVRNYVRPIKWSKKKDNDRQELLSG
jgi:hypothetical protein